MPFSLLIVMVHWLISMHACVFVCPCMCFFFESFVCCVSYELDLVSCFLFGGHLKILNFISELSFGILGYLLDLGLLSMIYYGWLSLVTPHIFQEAISYENLYAHTH